MPDRSPYRHNHNKRLPVPLPDHAKPHKGSIHWAHHPYIRKVHAERGDKVPNGTSPSKARPNQAMPIQRHRHNHCRNEAHRGRTTTSLHGFDRNRTGTYFQALPCTLFKRRRRHDMPMASPKLQVGRLAIINISERSMPVVTGTAQHGKITINLAREQHAITVEGRKAFSTWWNVLKSVVHATPMVGWPLYPLHQVT
mgnify:CR=1 FL=1